MHLDGDDVAKLDHNQFRSVMNALLTVEANEHGVPLPDLVLNTRDTDPDAGIDARIKWPASARHDPLPAGQIVLQYKSGKLTLPQLAKEFAKPGVQETLRQGGNYLLLVGHDYVDRSRDGHRKELVRLCKLRRHAISRCTILYGDQIARWASRYLAVWALPEFGKPLSGLVTVRQWGQDPLFQNEYFADANRSEIIAALREFVSSPRDRNTFRVEGLTGVGKSRVVLQALSSPGVSEAALYAPDAEAPQVQNLLAAVQSDISARGIIVVDECTSDRQEALMRFARLAGSRVRLICVGPAEILGTARVGLTGVYQVLPLGGDDIRAILNTAGDRFPQEVVSATVRVAGGYVKLALFVARILVRQKVPLVDLRSIDDVRQILKKFVPRGTAQTLGALSLLSRVGWEEEVRDEAKTLARVVGVHFTDMQHSVKELRKQGIVLPRGRYLYVSPDLLAINAAAELWDERGADLIRIVGDLPGEQPRRHLLLRLTMMAEHPEVRKAVERLLGEEGLYQTIEDLDEGFLSEVFLILSAALPQAAIDTLKRLLLGLKRSRLLDFSAGRRNVMWALESLLRWSETSLDAARCVRELALAETEHIANNATGIFCQYFHLLLSGTPVPFCDRLVVLDELTTTDEPVPLQLAVKAAAAALTRHESRSGRDEDSISGRSFPREWRPRTTDEFRNARRAAVHRLIVLTSRVDDVSHSAREALISSASTLAIDGLMDDALDILQRVEPDSAEQIRSRTDAAGWILRNFEKDLSSQHRIALQALFDSSFGEDLQGRLKRWVGRRLHSDFLPGGKGFQEADANAVKLADVGYAEGLADVDLSWLSSPEAENVWPFGKRLGQLDSGRRYFDRIVERSTDDVQCVFLASYVAGIASAQGEALWDELCDSLIATRPILAFGVSFRGPANNKAGQRILDLIQNGKVPDRALQILMYGGWVASLPVSERRMLLEQLLRRHDPALTGVALGVLHSWFEKEPAAANGNSDLIWEALEQPLAISDVTGDWHWGELAKLLASREPKRVALLAVSKMQEESSWVRFQDIGRAVLDAATKTDAEGVFGVLSHALLDRQSSSHRLLFALEHWYGDLIPSEVLVNWAQSNPSARWIVARLISVDGVPMPERLRALLKALPDDRDLLRSALASLSTGTWWGPYSARLQRERDVLRSWSLEEDSFIQKGAQTLIRRLDKAIEKQLKIEEEEGLSEFLATASPVSPRTAA